MQPYGAFLRLVSHRHVRDVTSSATVARLTSAAPLRFTRVDVGCAPPLRGSTMATNIQSAHGQRFTTTTTTTAALGATASRPHDDDDWGDDPSESSSPGLARRHQPVDAAAPFDDDGDSRGAVAAHAPDTVGAADAAAIKGEPEVTAAARVVTRSQHNGKDAVGPTTQSRQPDDREGPTKYALLTNDDLLSHIKGYLRTTLRVRNLHRPDDENAFFTLLYERIRTIETEALLTLIDFIWPKKTQERWGRDVKAWIRDRAMEQAHDLPPNLIARSIIVIGIFGHCIRDVDFFRQFGKLLSHNINEVKDPQTLCYVLIAMHTARIRPPDDFFALVGRRLPVLSKKRPIEITLAIRCFAYFHRVRYPQLNPYRFLADRVMQAIRANLVAEGRGAHFVEPKKIQRKPLVDRGEDDGEAGASIAGDSANTDTGDSVGTTSTLSPEEAAVVNADEISANDLALLDALRGRPSPDSTAPSRSTVATPQTGDDSEEGTASINATTTDAAASDVLPPHHDPKVRALVGTLPASDPDSGIGYTLPEHNQRMQLRHVPPDLLNQMPRRLVVRQKFMSVTNMTPPQLVRFLWVLATMGAPWQQYLRPIAKDLLCESAPFFNPPSFSRLIQTVNRFKAEDVALLQSLMDHMVRLGPKEVVFVDVVEMLKVLANENTIMLKLRTAPFYTLCSQVFTDGGCSRLRSRDMIDLVVVLQRIRRLEAADGPLTASEEGPADQTIRAPSPATLLSTIVDLFAARMNLLLDLGTVPLHHVEAFVDVARGMPAVGRLTPKDDGAPLFGSTSRVDRVSSPSDLSEPVQALRTARIAINEQDDDGDEGYERMLDIDVKEVFYRTQFINNINTWKAFRPMPPGVMTEYKAVMRYMRADYIIEGVHLFEQAYPGVMNPAIRRTLSLIVLDKLQLEWDILTGRRSSIPPPPMRPPARFWLPAAARQRLIEMSMLGAAEGAGGGSSDSAATADFAEQAQPPPDGSASLRRRLTMEDYERYDPGVMGFAPILVSAESVAKLYNLLMSTPMLRVKESPVTWQFLSLKARGVGAADVVAKAHVALRQLDQHVVPDLQRDDLIQRRRTAE